MSRPSGNEKVLVGTVVVMDGVFRGKTHTLGKRTELGRHPECDVVLVDRGVALRHAAITREGEAFVIEDLRSKTGTFVNRTRVKRRSLSSQDDIRLGSTRLRFVAEQRHRSRIPTSEHAVVFDDEVDHAHSSDPGNRKAPPNLAEDTEMTPPPAELAEAVEKALKRRRTRGRAGRSISMGTGPHRPLAAQGPGASNGFDERFPSLDAVVTLPPAGQRRAATGPLETEPPAAASPVEGSESLATTLPHTARTEAPEVPQQAYPTPTGLATTLEAGNPPLDNRPLDVTAPFSPRGRDEELDRAAEQPAYMQSDAEPPPRPAAPQGARRRRRSSSGLVPPQARREYPSVGWSDEFAAEATPVEQIPMVSAEEAAEALDLAAGAAPERRESGPDYAALYAFLRRAFCLVNSATSLSAVLGEILEHIFTLVPADHGCVLLYKPSRRTMLAGAQLSRVAMPADTQVTVSRTIVTKVVKRRASVLIHDASSELTSGNAASSIVSQGICSVICTPLIFQDELLGVIYLDTRNKPGAFNKELLKAVHAIAGPAAIAVKNSATVERLRRKSDEVKQGYVDTVTVLANAIEARDEYTIGHARRVTALTLELGKVLGWDRDELELLKIGCVLHDVGKVGVEDAILRKPSALTKAEYKKVQRHPVVGANILKDIKFLESAMPYILYHHERWDGHGYPSGLRGENIPVKGRILAVTDAFDAMTSSRPYRRGISAEEAVSQLWSAAGSQFDPTMVEAFFEAYRAGNLNAAIEGNGNGDQS